jgi:hypothetical protein
MRSDAAVARQRRLRVLVPEILAPRLDVLDSRAHPLPKLSQGVSKGIRIEVGEISSLAASPDEGLRIGIGDHLPRVLIKLVGGRCSGERIAERP